MKYTHLPEKNTCARKSLAVGSRSLRLPSLTRLAVACGVALIRIIGITLRADAVDAEPCWKITVRPEATKVEIDKGIPETQSVPAEHAWPAGLGEQIVWP